MADLLIGLDLGGTAIKFGIGDPTGQLLGSHSVATDAHEGPEAVINRMIAEIETLRERYPSQEIGAIGIGVPGLVDIATGTTKFLPNLPTQWEDVPLGQRIAEHFGCPVKVLNDARAATLGELKYGHGKSQPGISLAFFTLGTGVGGGVAIDGKLRLGEFGGAGELGHQTVEPNGLHCGCGNRGCLETVASGPAIFAGVIRLMKSGLAPKLHQKVDGDVGQVTIRVVGEVLEDEMRVKEVVQNAAEKIGIVTANVISTIHPDMIVIGGGVAELGEVLLERIRETIKWRVGMFPADKIRVEKSLLGPQAGVYGALALAELAMQNA